MVSALYALIYLTRVWDSNANTRALPIAIVNLEAGLQYRGHAVNVGGELTKGLMASGTFGHRTLPDAAQAPQAVQRGTLAFAIVSPKDFNANAVPGVQPGAGQVTVIASEGNNYAAAGFGRRFAQDLGHKANAILQRAALGAGAGQRGRVWAQPHCCWRLLSAAGSCNRLPKCAHRSTCDVDEHRGARKLSAHMAVAAAARHRVRALVWRLHGNGRIGPSG